MFGYRVPAPDEAMLISGGKMRGSNAGAPFRVVTGHGAFIMPFFRKVRFLSLSMVEAEISETCVTKQAIALSVRAVIAFKVGNDTESIVNAGQRFLSDQDQMSVLTGRIFAGHLRSIVGSMTVEEIITERQKLANEVLDGSAVEMAKIGLTIDSLQIQSIDDMKLGYIAAMAAPHNAAIQREAQIAQARADQEAAEAGQESQRRQAEFARQTSVVQAQYKAEVDRAQALASQAGPLTQAQAQREVIDAKADLAQREALLREQQLVAEVIKPAQAEAEKVRILAKADAEATEIQAAAAASHNRVSLDQLLIEQLPQIVKEAAGGMSGANVNIINGADGMGEMAAGLVGQGLAIFESVKRTLGTSEQKEIGEAK
ncbi:SPFH domain-containing protein [Actinocrispum wychmicini]|uniref:SPFH domain/Band 7 family protein n=1 Tax=Actinocrispum wychmicini TaxID=1213861 RepID=A0A4R2JDP0_9PSEU|nr:flotillin family protein [Actinocrispum wychmicini]TCO54908.1 SPFH domain/Band 7 family protein [Actinocrispum wychmicini]